MTMLDRTQTGCWATRAGLDLGLNFRKTIDDVIYLRKLLSKTK